MKSSLVFTTHQLQKVIDIISTFREDGLLS